MTNTNKIQLSKAEREAYALVGRVGGKATFRKKGKKGMSELGKMGARARWHKKTKKINPKEKQVL